MHWYQLVHLLQLTGLLLCLGACAGTDTGTAPLQPAAGLPQIADFSGHWEKDYQLSDDFNTRFNLFLFDLRRGIYPSQARGVTQGVSPGVGGSSEAIMGLARFTEEITRTPALAIEQDPNSISIEREQELPLICDYYDQQYARTQNTFGSEICGWNGQQLLFQMSLSDGLNIFHRVTLGPDGQQLNITTTVSSSQVGTAFTISNFYRRYFPPEDQFNCIFTLTRNNVCSQNGNAL